MQKHGIKYTTKRTLVCSMRAETKRVFQSVSLTSAGNLFIRQLKIFTILCLSTEGQENTVSIDFGVKNKF